MKPQCIDAVTQALGRPLAAQESKAIEDRVRQSMRELARTDPQWSAKSTADRLKAAGELASRQLLAEAALKRERVQLQVAAIQARQGEIAEYMAAHPKDTMFHALGETLRKIDVAVKGVHRETMTRLMDVLEAAQPGWFRVASDPAFVRDLVSEAFGVPTGNKAAADGARAWMEVAESLRQRFNRAGGDVGRLMYAYFPQPHDVARILKAGADQWVDFILPRMDRSQYLDDAGRRLGDAEMRTMLASVYQTISTDGLNQLEPGKIPPGVSALVANRGNQSRALHFDGPQAYLEYMDQFGRGSVFEAMMGHVRAMALNIAMVERMGPNAKATFALLHDQAKTTGANDILAATNWKVSTREAWDSLTGRASQINDVGRAYVRRADFFQGVRNWQVISKLQGTLLSAITDIPTYYMTTGYNRAGFLDASRMLLRAFTPGQGTTEAAAHLGIVSESLAQDMGRMGSELLREGWTARLANTTMRVSLLNAWTDAMRRAAGLTVMGSLGRQLDRAWSSLDNVDRTRMTRMGIDERTWEIMRLAQVEDWGGARMVTPEALRAIPDEALLSGPVRAEVEAQQATAQAEIDELGRRNQQEGQWLNARLAGYRKLEARMADRLNRFMSSQDATVQRARGMLETQRELLAARLERAQTEAEVDVYLAARDSSEGRGRALQALRRGEDAATKTAFAAGARTQRGMEAGPVGVVNALEQADATMARLADRADARTARVADQLDQAGDRTVQRAANAGERLGERRGRAAARVAELERRAATAQRDADDAVMARYDEMRDGLQSKLDELDAWYVRMEERVGRRQAVMDRITREIPERAATAAQKARDDAVTRLVGALVDETEYASLAPDLFTRARIESVGGRGTWTGELGRSMLQFKSFPIALISRHWTRMLRAGEDGGGLSRAQYAALVFGGMALMGGVSVMLKDIAAGRDPQDPTDPRFWTRAVAAGGGLSFLGDVMLGMVGSGNAVGGQNSVGQVGGAVLGPAAGTVIELGDVTVGNLVQALRGKETDTGAEALRFVRSNLPFANLWYTRTLLDRAVLHDVQEQLSPGYLRRMERRAKENFGTEFWWRPGEGAPERGPELEIGGGR